MTIKGYLFDMDGLLINSEPQWQQVETEVFASVGIKLTDSLCHQTTGMRTHDVISHWYQRYPWHNRTKQDVCNDIIHGMSAAFEQCVNVKPGAVDLIRRLADNPNNRLAICSGSPLLLIETVAKKLQIGQYMQVLHSTEVDEFGKPHPLPYIKCAQLLGCQPADCVVFEDSGIGAISGKAAGMTVVAVPEGEYSEDKFAFCDQVLTSLADYQVLV